MGLIKRGALTYARLKATVATCGWMDRQLRVYSKFKNDSERDLIEAGFRSYSLRCWTVNVWLVTDQELGLIFFLCTVKSWDCAEQRLISKFTQNIYLG